MIFLRANSELKMTYDKLIQTMKVPVKWNGIFVVIDNYIILQGEVRSLFFHFDSRKVVTNIIDIPLKSDEVQETGNNQRVRNVINMILYAFGKWGNISGIKVEKNYAQLNQLFREVMRELSIEPDYTAEYFRFYKNKIRITYEEVIETALEPVEEEIQEEKKKSGGLWHKLIWKRMQDEFACEETTLRERRKVRLGNNFYLVGYLCPDCGEKMHMVVYPPKREFRIETDEGAVLLARAFACGECNCFYTPRPECLLSEGEAYQMPFGDDKDAFEDYLELLGKGGSKTSNYNYNRFVDQRRNTGENVVEEPLEESCKEIEDCTDEELWRLTDCMEEAFYPDKSVQRYEEKVRKQRRERGLDWRKRRGFGASRRQRGSFGTGETERERQQGGRYEEARREELKRGKVASEKAGKPRQRLRETEDANLRQGEAGKFSEKEQPRQDLEKFSEKEQPRQDLEKFSGKEQLRQGLEKFSGKEQSRQDLEKLGQIQGTQAMVDGSRSGKELPEQGTGAGDDGEYKQLSENKAGNGDAEREEIKRKYEAKINVCNRFSERQLVELKNQLKKDTNLAAEERQEYLEQVEEQLIEGRVTKLSKKVEECQDKSYGAMRKVRQEVEEEDIPQERKLPLLERLKSWMGLQGTKEVAQLVTKMPASMDKAQYRSFMEKLKGYGEDVDIAVYEEKLRGTRERIEKQEIADVVKRARKNSRRDLADLVEKLKKGDYLPELVAPYMEKLQNKIRQLDSEVIAELCQDVSGMSYAEGIKAYEQIEQGDFLPELKEDALNSLARRLSRLKSDESELLVRKLQEALQEAGVKENDRHHYYPARKVLAGEAEEEETEVIDYALASYGAGRGMFEYPIVVVDTSRNRSGKDGIILTPDYLYYSTLLTAYRISVASIEEVTASTGLLNRGVYVHQKDGSKTKLPYAVDAKELLPYAETLNEFIHYLQEKPESRDLTYLAKEKHETICCFRCGYVYRGGTVCPKCGYQNNG